METNKSDYEKKAKKKNLLSEITTDLETKHNIKNTAIETGKDMVVGVLGGGVVGAAIGRASLLVGAAVTAVGHYTKSRLASIFGLGLMASNGFQKKDTSVSGTGGNIMADAKERVITFKDNFSQKLYLDKIKNLKKEVKDSKTGELKSSSTTTKLLSSKTSSSGEEKPVGDVTFQYPHAHEIENAAHQDFSALDHVGDLLHKSAEKYQKENGTEGFSEEVGNVQELDPGERNY